MAAPIAKQTQNRDNDEREFSVAPRSEWAAPAAPAVNVEALTSQVIQQLDRRLLAYRERMVDLKKDPRFEYILVFKNHGAAAGASLEHPHSQLIATPIIPIMVSEELAGSAMYFDLKERCVWCDMIRQERRGRARLVLESRDFVTLSPFSDLGDVKLLELSSGNETATYLALFFLVGCAGFLLHRAGNLPLQSLATAENVNGVPDNAPNADVPNDVIAGA